MAKLLPHPSKATSKFAPAVLPPGMKFITEDEVEERTTKVPEDHKLKFAALLAELERDTGKHYKVILHQFGCYSNHQVTIGDFKTRGPWRVFDAIPKYEALNGVYATSEELEAKVRDVRHPKGPWECQDPNCKAMNVCENPSNCRLCKCTSCKLWNSCDSLTIGWESGTIYISGGGSISICNDVAKLELLSS